MALTERIVRDAKEDGEVIGLGLQITQGGRKNDILRCRTGGLNVNPNTP